MSTPSTNIDKEAKELKQWELPNNSKVLLSDNTWALFIKMDGMYAQWYVDGEFSIGNYKSFIKEGDYYKVLKT